jgi:hypothetical protein
MSKVLKTLVETLNMSKVYSKPAGSFQMAYYPESILLACTSISTTHSDLENVL